MADQTSSHPLSPMLRKLQRWQKLEAQEQKAVLALPCKVQGAESSRSIVRDGSRPQHCCLIISGFAFGYRIVANGSRSINAIHMAGDLVDVENAVLRVADHSVTTLTRCEVAFIPHDAIRELACAFPNVGVALWYDTLVDASILREWIANISRRNAAVRIAHFLCEFGVRLEAAGLGSRVNYELPMTQEQLADCTGLTSVHVNRKLKALHDDGIITRSKRKVVIADWDTLSDASGFRQAYLHLPEKSNSPQAVRNVRFLPKADL